MLRKLALAVLFVTLGAVSAMAADFGGKWTADIAGRQGNTTTTFQFTVPDGTARVYGRDGKLQKFAALDLLELKSGLLNSGK